MFQRCYKATSFLRRRMTKDPDRQKQTDKVFWKPKNPAMSGNRQFVALQRLHHNTVYVRIIQPTKQSFSFLSIKREKRASRLRAWGKKEPTHTYTSQEREGERRKNGRNVPANFPARSFSFPVLVRHLVYQAGKYLTQNARLKWGNYKLSDPNTICRYILVTYVQVCTQLQNLPFFVCSRKIPKIEILAILRRSLSC